MQSTFTVGIQDRQRGVTSQFKEWRFDYGATFTNPEVRLQRGDKGDNDCQRFSLCPYRADLCVQHNCIAARKVALIVLIFDISARFHLKICCKKKPASSHTRTGIHTEDRYTHTHTHSTLLCLSTRNTFKQCHVTQTHRNACMQMQTSM